MRHKVIAVLVAAAMVVLGLTLPPRAEAICDIGGARVIHAETTPEAVGATATIFWLAQNLPAPTVYYVFVTANQTFINHLNAAHAANLQVRVRGDAAACGTSGVFRTGGNVLRVFRDSFS